MSDERCKHGVLFPARCRDCENEPIDAAELARFRRDVLGVEEESNAAGQPTSETRSAAPALLATNSTGDK